MIRAVPITSETQWQDMRRRNVGASEAPALFGVHDYLTALKLWARKTGREPDEGESAPMKRGRKMEPVACEMIAEDFPAWKIERPATYFSDDDLRLGATPDVFATDPTHGLGVIQIKSVEPGVFKRRWFDDDNHLRPPLGVAVQAITEAHMTGAKWAACAAIVVEFGIYLHIVDVPLHEGIVRRVRDETAKFWHLVDSGRQPDPDFGRDLMVLRSLFAQDDGSEIDLSGDNELPAILAQREIASDQIKVSQAQLDTCNAMLLHKLGTAQVGRFSGGYISAKTINRKGYEVKPTTYRQLRVVHKDEAA